MDFFRDNQNLIRFCRIVNFTYRYALGEMKEAIKKDGYPWLKLIELNDTNQIWTKYRIPNAAGGTFLVNAEGIILAINPTVEEIESILQKELLTP